MIRFSEFISEGLWGKAYKQVQKFIKRPVYNNTAKDWIKFQKERK